MITAVDSNILLDIFIPDEFHFSESKERLTDACKQGTVIVSKIVYAEIVPSFENQESLDRALKGLGVIFSLNDSSIAYEAGLRWKRYREAGGPRDRIIADFLIGAHALISADSFLTRDRGFFATYFPELPRAK